jgi:hypothetical protein
MPLRPPQGPPGLPLLALLASGCFVDYAPNVTSAGDDGTGSSTGAPIATTGGDTGSSGDGPALVDSHGDPPADTGGSTSEPGEASTDTGEAPLDPTLTPPDDPEHACLDAAMGDACGECLCERCLAQYEACAEDRGCVAIMQCAVDHGCLGLTCLGPCGAVIEEHGGPVGPSSAAALDLSVCAEDECLAC